MQVPDTTAHTRAQAEDAFARFLAEHEIDDGKAFRRLCGRRPELVGDLRRLRREFGRLQSKLDDVAEVEELKTIFAGRLADLDGERARRAEEARAAEVEETCTLLNRLSAHRVHSERLETRGEVARGGMGVILRAWDADLRRTLAMKVLPDSLRQGDLWDRALARFLEEAQVTGQLDHPGIVPVHELGMDSKGRVFFTMPLVRGRDFKGILKLIARGEQGWTLTRALGVLIKVCEAMGYAHSKGVLHRDLKPSNVMVGRFGEVYVMDWGLARVMGRRDTRDLRLRPEGSDDAPSAVSTDRSLAKSQTPDSPLLTMDGDVVGTPSYMSPEQAEGRTEELGPRSEVYAIGAMLYQLLTGQMPYVGSGSRLSARTVLGLLLQGPPPDVLEVAPEVDPELAAICRKAMQRQPLKRYADTLELARDIESFQGQRPIRARRGTPLYRARLALQRNRGIAWTAAASLAALLMAAGIFVRGLQRAAGEEHRLRGIAEQALAVTERLGDVDAADVLVREADELYPALPQQIPAFDAWIARAEDVLGRRELHAKEASAAAPSASRASFLANLESLAALLPAVAARRSRAESVVRRTVQAHAQAWAQAARDVAADERFGAFELNPIPGLVPLRRHPETDLWEFWHVATGERPTLDAETGALELRPESGVVLVLLPGGSRQLGSPPDEAGRVPELEALRDVVIEPFLFAKYELTQAQWQRVMEANDSKLRMGEPPVWSIRLPGDEELVSGLHPVERVNWFDCVEFGRRTDLELPTEEQWEYACRAGTAGRWCWGDDVTDLESHENLADEASIGLQPNPDIAPWNDGYTMHAPVGSFAENGFGLFDVHGNVSEWCRDEFGEKKTDRAFRGGSWYLPLQYTRAAFRQSDHPRAFNFARGMRPARRATP